MIESAFLMTAGLGTRLLPFTERIAKPLVPILGVPVVQFSLDLLENTEVDLVGFNVHHLAESFLQGMRFLKPPKCMFRVSDERSQLLGSGGGVRQAYELFSSDPKRKGKAFFLLNADMLLDMNLQDLEEHHEFMRDHYGVRMTLVIFSKAPGRLKYTKIVIDDIRGLIRSLGEPISGGPFYVGAAIIEPDALERLNPGEIAGFTEKILEPAIRAGRAGALIYDTSREDSMSRSWYDVGDPESWRLTQLELLSRLRNYSLPARWEQRLRLHVRDLGEGVFVSSRSSLLEKPSSWEGPCFWSPLLPSDAPPTRMHEGSVVYGSGIEVGPHSIAYGDLAFSTEAEPHS